MSDLQIIPSYQDFVKMLPGNKGVAVANDIPLEALIEAFHVYGSIVADGLWSLGDLAIAADQNFGEEWYQGVNGMHYSYKTLQNAASVCKKFPPGQRHNLSFNHHASVQGIEDVQAREEILTKAEKEHWPVSRVNEERKKLFPKKAKAKKNAKPSESPQDGAGAIETLEELDDHTPPREITKEEASKALETLLDFFNHHGKELPKSVHAALEENMNLLRRAARKSGFYGGN